MQSQVVRAKYNEGMLELRPPLFFL